MLRRQRRPSSPLAVYVETAQNVVQRPSKSRRLELRAAASPPGSGAAGPLERFRCRVRKAAAVMLGTIESADDSVNIFRVALSLQSPVALSLLDSIAECALRSAPIIGDSADTGPLSLAAWEPLVAETLRTIQQMIANTQSLLCTGTYLCANATALTVLLIGAARAEATNKNNGTSNAAHSAVVAPCQTRTESDMLPPVHKVILRALNNLVTIATAQCTPDHALIAAMNKLRQAAHKRISEWNDFVDVLDAAVLEFTNTSNVNGAALATKLRQVLAQPGLKSAWLKLAGVVVADADMVPSLATEPAAPSGQRDQILRTCLTQAFLLLVREHLRLFGELLANLSHSAV